MSSEQTARHVIFHGRVQGVGFRATSHSIAGRFSVSGYVRNLADGTVELRVEGPNAEVENFLTAVREQFDRNLTDVNTRTVDVTGEFSGFQIRR